MRPIHDDLPSKYFSSTRPAGVVTAQVCRCSGLLPTEDCKNDPRGDQVYTEYFVKGTVPTETCKCHTKVKICKETGLLANEYCKDIEEKVFITRPNVDTNTNWKSAKDAEYTLTIKDTCTVHKKPAPTTTTTTTKNTTTTTKKTEPVKKPDNNTVVQNNVTSDNTITNNTIPENTIDNNVPVSANAVTLPPTNTNEIGNVT